jgi:phosphate transport system protein
MKATVQKILVRVMAEEPHSIRAALEYIRAAQQLERIGDLSTNISEEVVFLVEGGSIKHHAAARNGVDSQEEEPTSPT